MTGTNFSEDIQLDAKAITGIRVFENEDRVSIYTAKGEIFRGSKDALGTDIESALTIFRDAGAELFPFPVYGPEGRNHIYTSYILHHAIQYARVGASHMKGYKRVEIGVDGMPGDHSYAIGQKQLKPFYDALQLHHGSMRHYEAPSVVIAGKDTTYVHAWLVTQMHAEPDNVLRIKFGSGAHVDLPVCDGKAQRLAKALYSENLTSDMLGAHLQEEARAEMHTIMTVLAGDIACYTPHIFQVPNVDRVTYLPKAKDAWLQCADGQSENKKLLILHEPQSHRSTFPLSMQFNTEADRKAAIKKISKEMTVRFVDANPSCHP
ncbi:hypothetical protein [Micavibrio aeruginosavorus]|uniref:hypothetical protein n=1 Tax=Micavibrio aeruginosavorus TaxID=349221 RepID=UPI003F4A916A